MHKNFEINQTKIKGGCQSGRKVNHNSKSDFPLVVYSRLHNAFPHVSQRIAVVSDVRSDLTHANMF